MPSLLEDIETTPRSGFSRSYRAFLDERSPGEVNLSKQFYEIIDDQSETLLSDILSSCRTQAWFIRHAETGRVRLATKQCRLRWCYHCSEARQQYITQAVLPWYEHARDPKLLTVTVRHSSDPLPEQIDFLYKSWAKLRNRKLLKEKIRGGIWFFQVTYNQKTQQWHPHIHALLDADYMPHAYLMNLWGKITNGSTILHIRRVDCPERTLAHNARYAARPSALSKIPRSLWGELFDAFNGRRICGKWGTAKEVSLRPQKPEDHGMWKAVGDFITVRALFDDDESAKAIWRAWTMDEELEEGVSLKSIEDFIDDKETPGPRPPPIWEIEPFFNWKVNF